MRAIAVTEPSQVAEARRAASELATGLGLDTSVAGRAALVATELGTNLIKHGGGGEILLAAHEDGVDAAVQLIALDKGRGIPNVSECMRDGYSTAATAGHGLGAVKRQSNLMEVASWPGIGTAILARIHGAPVDTAAVVSTAVQGCVSVPKTGEEVCGDSCMVADPPAGRTLLVADGLGHGPLAATAAMEAVRLFTRHQHLPVAQILEFMHAGLRPTRGAAIAIARFEANRNNVVYGGIGNIAGSVVAPSETRRMISLNGTAGHVARRIQTFDYPCQSGLVIMHSDGLSMLPALDRYAGIHTMHPTLVAAVLYRDFSRGRDDATVLVARAGHRA